MSELYKELKKYGLVKTNVDLSKYSTLKIGGKAAFLVEVQKEAILSQMLSFLTAEGIKFFVLGGGSNILFPDEDFDGVVIKIAISQIEVMDEVIEAWAGTPLSLVLNTAVKNGLAGLEWAAGIPGTLGGAVRGNAGAVGQSMKDCIQKVFVWSDGEIREFSNEECEFDYRESVFKREPEKVIIKAVLNLKKGEKQDILQQISQNLLSRKKYSILPSAGSFFKNIPLQNWPDSKDKLPELFIERKMVPAGWLIENCGLKGFKIGEAGVSQEHGNFLVNLGKATHDQFLQLVEEIQKKVYDKYGVGLEPEVQIMTP